MLLERVTSRVSCRSVTTSAEAHLAETAGIRFVRPGHLAPCLIILFMQDFNLRTAAAYFSDTLNGNQGDVLLSVGTYNGWYKGLTEVSSPAVQLGIRYDDRPPGRGNCCK